MDWNDLRHFLALARTGSVRAAGASLGVSHSTVARRVEALEERLAARLFDRTPTGYQLTPAGQQMVPGAERVEQEMAALERGVLGQDERLAGQVALTCCDAYVSGLLVNGLAGLCAEHPEISLRVLLDSRLFDLGKREADVAVRIKGKGSQPADHLIGRKLAPLNIANYVGRAHAARLDPTRGDVRWLVSDQDPTMVQLVAGSSYPHLPMWGAFMALPLLVQAAEAGMGVVMLPTYVGDACPGLQRLPHSDLRHVADLWLLSHPDLRDNARFRAVRDCIWRAVQAQRGLFEGTRSESAPAGPENAPGAGPAPAVP